MRPIHALGPLAIGTFLIVSVMAMLGTRYAPSYEAPGSITTSDCNVSCGQDSQLECESTEHIAYSGYAVDETAPHGSHSSCEDGTCAWEGGSEGMHPSCIESLNLARSGDYERLKAAIAAQDDRSLQQLLRRYSKVVVVNAKRESIQVVSCDGIPRANLPLHTQQFERLVSTQ